MTEMIKRTVHVPRVTKAQLLQAFERTCHVLGKTSRGFDIGAIDGGGQWAMQYRPKKGWMVVCGRGGCGAPTITRWNGYMQTRWNFMMMFEAVTRAFHLRDADALTPDVPPALPVPYAPIPYAPVPPVPSAPIPYAPVPPVPPSRRHNDEPWPLPGEQTDEFAAVRAQLEFLARTLRTHSRARFFPPTQEDLRLWRYMVHNLDMLGPTMTAFRRSFYIALDYWGGQDPPRELSSYEMNEWAHRIEQMIGNAPLDAGSASRAGTQ